MDRQRARGPLLDRLAGTHRYADMRTTIDIPDDLYRTLKTRAALSGSSLRDVIQQLLESGLRQAEAPLPRSTADRPPPPVIISASGSPIPALTSGELKQLEEEEELEHRARLA